MTITTGINLLPFLVLNNSTDKTCPPGDQEHNRHPIFEHSMPNSSFGLFVSIAFVLSLHSIILVHRSIMKDEKKRNKKRGDKYHVYLLEHQFTSPDAPVKALDDIIPQR